MTLLADFIRMVMMWSTFLTLITITTILSSILSLHSLSMQHSVITMSPILYDN